jgi:glycosyltransferase involved in cell wall biosynthesis
MKILFINAQDIRGGASMAAYRLSKGLEKLYGTENYFIVGKKHSANSNIFCTRTREYQIIVEALTDKIMNKLGLQYQYFPYSTRFILKKARELKPDIISLHNTHEGYFKTALLKKLSKIAPIAWTLHDMWSFTANAVHTFDDESWKRLRPGKGEKRSYPHIGINTGRWLLKQKRRIYRKSDIHVITPSQWLGQLASQSPVFENKPVVTIPHGIDLEFFNPRDKTTCRKALGIDEDAKVLLFCSAGDIDISPWKGGPLLTDILTEINRKTNRKLVLIAIGKGEMKEARQLEHLELYRVGYVSSQSFMPLLYSAADLMIYPTRADTFPLVLVESVASGTPAITFDIGGCGDIIRSNTSGVLVPSFDIDSFAAQTLQLLDNPAQLAQLSASARNFAEEHLDIAGMAKKHYELFTNITAAKEIS